MQRGCTTRTGNVHLFLVLGIVKQFGPAGFHQRGEGCAAERQRLCLWLCSQPSLRALAAPAGALQPPSPAAPWLSLPQQWEAGTRAQRGAGELGSPAERRDAFCLGTWCEVSLVQDLAEAIC